MTSDPPRHSPTTPSADAPERRRSEVGISRMMALSDGVFAIAMTLLVLNLRVPDLQAGPDGAVPNAELVASLLNQLPSFTAFSISFWVIGLYWANHHRVVGQLREFDGPLLYLNLLFLFFIAVLPFPTSVLGQFAPASAAVVLYAVNVAAVGLALTLFSLYAGRRGLWHPEITAIMQRRGVLRGLGTTAIFIVSIPLALVNGEWGITGWWLVVPGIVLINRLVPDPGA